MRRAMSCCQQDLFLPPSRRGFRGRGRESSCVHAWDAFYRELCSLYPTLSTSMGYDRDNGRVEDWGAALLEKERRLVVRYAEAAGRPTCGEAAVFRHHLDVRLRCMEVDRVRLFHVDGGWCVRLLETLTTYQPYDTPSDVDVAEERLRRLPEAIRKYADFLGLEATRRPPPRRVVGGMSRRVAAAARAAAASVAAAQGNVPERLVDLFASNCVRPIETVVLPLLGRVECRETIGLSELDPSVYDGAVYRHVTLDGVSAEDIHTFGLAEVARLEDELRDADVREETSAPGGAAEVVARYASIVDAVQTSPDLFALFGDLRPSRPCRVAEMPEADRAGGPLAYYSNSVFYVNTAYPHPTHQMEALAFHEAVPGHHTQRRIERDTTPRRAYRYAVHHTAFVEGWAMYAETLVPPTLRGGARGVVESEMFRAVRLVVDTGIHRMGWTYERALTYMKVHGRVSDAECESEVLRYACDPGQALGYHVGRIVFLDIARAHAADLPAVHRRILLQGSVPMSMLVRQFANYSNWEDRGARGSGGQTTTEETEVDARRTGRRPGRRDGREPNERTGVRGGARHRRVPKKKKPREASHSLAAFVRWTWTRRPWRRASPPLRVGTGTARGPASSTPPTARACCRTSRRSSCGRCCPILPTSARSVSTSTRTCGTRPAFCSSGSTTRSSASSSTSSAVASTSTV